VRWEWIGRNPFELAEPISLPHSEPRPPTAEQAAVIQQVERAFDNNVNSTPTFILNGQVLSFGPEGIFAIDAIKSALGLPITPAAKKTAAKKK